MATSLKITEMSYFNENHVSVDEVMETIGVPKWRGG